MDNCTASSSGYHTVYSGAQEVKAGERSNSLSKIKRLCGCRQCRMNWTKAVICGWVAGWCLSGPVNKIKMFLHPEWWGWGGWKEWKGNFYLSSIVDPSNLARRGETLPLITVVLSTASWRPIKRVFSANQKPPAQRGHKRRPDMPYKRSLKRRQDKVPS